MSLLRPAWKPIAATVALGSSGYLLYSYTRQTTFDITVRTRGEDGQRVSSTRTLPLLPMSDLDARIRQNATAESRARPGGVVWKHTTASLASNDPIEDANANAIIQRDPDDPSAPGDLLFFAVMDGHSGYHTSQLLSRVLINAVTLELSLLNANRDQESSPTSFLGSLKSSLWRTKPASNLGTVPDSDPNVVAAAIENAFVKLDKELLEAPLRVLANSLDPDSLKNKVVPDLSKHPLALQTMLPAVSGSCALMAVFDTAHQNLYVSCTGDSRAVAGVWEPSDSGDGGSWRVEVLSDDQTGRNPKEVERVHSEHPPEEIPVIRDGRILGGLEPSRAFGDARYKWPREVQAVLSEAFLAGNGQPMRPPPTSFKTPPYVTARPVVTHHKLSLPAASPDALDASASTSPASSAANPALRFLVLATDGLWDELSSEDVVRLVGGHLAGIKGPIPKSTLPTLVPTTTGRATVDGKSASTKERKRIDGTWAFKDDNVSAHLIRNAFGGADEGRLRKLLSIPAPYSRRYRDDITVTVVWWEEGNEDTAKVEQVKARL